MPVARASVEVAQLQFCLYQIVVVSHCGIVFDVRDVRAVLFCNVQAVYPL